MLLHDCNKEMNFSSSRMCDGLWAIVVRAMVEIELWRSLARKWQSGQAFWLEI